MNMKTYSKPQVNIIEMETTHCVMSTSTLSINDTEVNNYYEDRKRRDAWIKYEDR